MLAIQRANPQAFINGNINLMKAGFVLRMPSLNDALDLTTAQANAEVARQTDVWRGIARPSAREQVADASPPSLRQQVRATPDAPPPSATEAAASGTLQIVAGEGDVAQGSTGDGLADAQALEENERLSREVDELTYQMDREREQATDQIAVRDRRLEVQDQQLAALRQELEKTQAQLDALRANPQSQPQSRPADTSTPFWASSTFMLVAGAALVLALIGGLLFMRKRQAASATQAYAERTAPEEGFAIGDVSDTRAEEDDARTEARAFAQEDRHQEDGDDALDLLEDLDDMDDAPDPALAALDDLPEETAVTPPSLQTSDVIGEADIYAAYGRYPHAIGLLTGALEEDANRHDVRLKLLEVCVAAQDTETFDTHLSELLDRCSDQDILLAARELEESMPERMPRETGMDAGASAALAAGFVAAGAASRDASSEDDDAFDLDEELFADDLLADADTDSVDGDDGGFLDLDDLEAEVDDLLANSHAADDAEEIAIPELDDVEAGEDLLDAALDGLADDDDMGSDASFDLHFEDELPASGERGDAIAHDEDDFESGFFSRTDEVAADDDIGGDDDDYQALGSVTLDDEDDLEGSLGGDLGLDFDPEAEETPDAEAAAEPALALGDDDLEIEDLLAELDADADLLGEDAGALGSVVFDDEADTGVREADDGGAEILSFSRPEADALGDSGDLAAGPLGGAVADDDFDDDVFADDADAADTKLDLAQAYIDMGDEDGARDILGEVLLEGTDAQRNTAQSLLDGLAS
jgi:pilus assembly protein FimV